MTRRIRAMGKVGSLWEHVAVVASESDPDKGYQIKRYGDGRMACGCPAYQFARGAKTCKHLRALASADGRHIEPTRYPMAEAVTVGTERFTVRRAMSLGDGPIGATP